MASELRETIPTFHEADAQGEGDVSITNWSALTSANFARSGGEAMVIALFAVIIIGAIEFAVRAFNIPDYVFPRPSEIGKTLFTEFNLFWPHLQVTLRELFVGFAIGASIGLILAAVITQFPFVEKIITPYILLLVT